MQNSCRSVFVFFSLLLWLLLTAPLHSVTTAPQDAGHVENVKAVFIYHFTKYIDWTQEDSLFTIGIVGETPVLKPLQQIAEKKCVRQHAIQIQSCKHAGQIEACQILFIPESQHDSLDEIIRLMDGKPVLIISEIEDALSKGAMINFVLKQETIRFEINLKAMKQTGFRPSSEMLKLAVRVIE